MSKNESVTKTLFQNTFLPFVEGEPHLVSCTFNLLMVLREDVGAAVSRVCCVCVGLQRDAVGDAGEQLVQTRP